MEKFKHRFINGEVFDDKVLNSLGDKVNEIIDTNDDLYQVAEQVNEIKTTINNLPNAQAVSVQVQRNTEAIATKADKANTPTNSSFVGTMGAGYALQLIGNGKGETRYGEVFPAGRPWGDAGQLTPEGGATNLFNGTDTFPSGMAQHFPSQVQGTKSITIEKIGGECLGAQQMAHPNINNKVIDGIKFTKNDTYYNINGSTTGSSVSKLYDIPNIVQGRKYLSGMITSKQIPTDIDVFIDQFSQFGNTPSRTFRNTGLRVFTAISNGENCKISIRFNSAGTVVDNIDFSMVYLDLTTLFPSPAGQKFVNNLTNNEASALAVAQRLGYFDYTIRY